MTSISVTVDRNVLRVNSVQVHLWSRRRHKGQSFESCVLSGDNILPRSKRIVWWRRLGNQSAPARWLITVAQFMVYVLYVVRAWPVKPPKRVQISSYTPFQVATGYWFIERFNSFISHHMGNAF